MMNSTQRDPGGDDARLSGKVVLIEPRRFRSGVAADVLSAQDWAQLGELEHLLSRVNALYAQAEADIAEARHQGYAAGFAEGLERAQGQMAQQLASLNERRARVLAGAAARVTDLACAIVARLAPGFDAARAVPPLVAQAVEAAQAEQFLMIRVHPSARDGVASRLGLIRQAHPIVGVLELVDDESLDPLSCVVVSEAGEVRAGVSQQLEAIRQALATAQASSSEAAG